MADILEQFLQEAKEEIATEIAAADALDELLDMTPKQIVDMIALRAEEKLVAYYRKP